MSQYQPQLQGVFLREPLCPEQKDPQGEQQDFLPKLTSSDYLREEGFHKH
jgi:hypothetical protein